MKLLRVVPILCPLALSALALGVREARRSPALPAPAPGAVESVPGPPSFLAGLSTVGRWSVVAADSHLGLSSLSDGAWREARAMDLSGTVVIEEGGRLAELDVEGRLTPGQAARVLGVGSEGRIALHGASARSVPSPVSGVRFAQQQAWAVLDGERRDVGLRVVWMPIGPGRLRLQLEGGWRGPVLGAPDALRTLIDGPSETTLALDLVLTRS